MIEFNTLKFLLKIITNPHLNNIFMIFVKKQNESTKANSPDYCRSYIVEFAYCIFSDQG